MPRAILKAVRATDRASHAAGTKASFTSDPLERPLRDIHLAAQRAAALPVHQETVAKG